MWLRSQTLTAGAGGASLPRSPEKGEESSSAHCCSPVLLILAWSRAEMKLVTLTKASFCTR